MSASSNNFSQHCSSNQLNSFRKAITTNNKQSIEKHLSHMKSISEAQLNAALFTCIENFRLEDQSDQCLFLLLRNKANPNCEINGQTPLMAACKIAQLTLVKHLIENGAKPDLCNLEGKHPLEFVLNSRKQNSDIAEYLISVISSVNIQIGKTQAIVVTIEKQFSKIFKMLVDKGAALYVQNNEQTILHIIMKKTFKDIRKKKRFIKQLANRGQLSIIKDKLGKLPIQYETEEQVKQYYNEIFKPKIKLFPEKDLHHYRPKEKDLHLKEVSREKQQKKKIKEQEPTLTVDQQAGDQEQNDEEAYQTNQEDDKEKIVEVIEEEQEEKKVEEEKEKAKKLLNKILTPVAVQTNAKKIMKALKPTNQKSIIAQKSIIPEKFDKEKLKKINNEKKKKQLLTASKKIKSIPNKQQQKRQEEPKKRISFRNSHKEQEPKKQKKGEMVQLQKQEIKVDQIDSKNISLCSEQGQSTKKLVNQSISIEEKAFRQSTESLDKQFKNISISQSDQSELEKEEPAIDIEEKLTTEIFSFYQQQQKQYKELKPIVQEIMMYLENKMKLCVETHTNTPFSFKIELYGSQATGMAVSQSDIDIIIITNLSSTDLMNMFQFYQLFQEDEIKDVKFIRNTSIPVIKLKLSEDFKHFNVDLSFMFRGHRGLRCVELMNQFKVAEPLLQPLVLTLKRLIYAYNLSDPYTGGVSSYSLTLMVIAFLQLTNIQKIKEHLGKIFLQFLLFYGYQLDYVCQAIIIQPPFHTQQVAYSYQYFYNIYQLPNTMDLTPKLVIYDPLDPVNNVGRSTYRIESLKNMFRVAYIRLKLQEISILKILEPELLDLIQQTL